MVVRRYPAIPSLQGLEAVTYKALTPMKRIAEILTSYKFDLSALSKIVSAISGYQGWTDYGPTSVPAGLTVTYSFRLAFLEWDIPDYPNHDHTVVLRYISDDLGSAVEIAKSVSSVFVDYDIVAGTQYFYWIQHVSQAGITSAVVGSVSGTVPKLGLTDFADTLVPPRVDPVYRVPGTMVYQTADNKLYTDNGTSLSSKIDGANINATSIVVGALSTTPGGRITANEIAAGAISVGSGKIANLAIGAGAFTGADITSAKIVDATIQSAKIDALTVGTANIKVGAVTNAKIKAATLTSATFDTITVQKMEGDINEVQHTIDATGYSVTTAWAAASVAVTTPASTHPLGHTPAWVITVEMANGNYYFEVRESPYGTGDVLGYRSEVNSRGSGTETATIQALDTKRTAAQTVKLYAATVGGTGTINLVSILALGVR